MKASEVISQLKKAIEQIEADGHDSVAIPGLKAYLQAVEKDAIRAEAGLPAMSPEQRSELLEIWKTKVGMGAEMLKATVEASQTALKSAILINGGAAAAMLAFVGNAVTKSDLRPGSPILSHVGAALFIFMVGTGLAGSSTAFRYLSQRCYQDGAHDGANPLWERWGHIFTGVCIVLGVASFASFFAGGYLAFRAVVLP